ncbi:MAG TPA: M28 family peptidase [Myxococcota bacterium]|nr:M28 family peptidase [Myxococcota bacterium]
MIRKLRINNIVMFIICFTSSANLFALKSPVDASRTFREAVTVSGIRAHQRAFQDIADRNGGNRMASSAGYEASVRYVKQRLEDAGYNVTLQAFPLTISRDQNVPELSTTTPKVRGFEAGVDFASMTTRGSVEVTGDIEAVDLTIPSLAPDSATSGCETDDFANFTPGNIALLQRGACEFTTKIENAIAAGARGAIIFNEGNEGRTELISSRVTTSRTDFPVLGASFHVGSTLRDTAVNGPTGISVFMKVEVALDIYTVENVIAETASGDENRVVVVGAHLDGVRQGPGINDNGSGSATILEMALKFQELSLTPRNKLRFIWFGAEEFGLIGSEFYVNSLSGAEQQKILAMLNFDMIGSSNYARFVYDGDNSSQSETLAASGPEGSGLIEKILLDYFRAQGQESHPTAFNGRSDYGPFIQVGIPAGGVFSGAEGIKSARLANVYGGTAGAPFDPCYHRSCDDFTHTGGSDTYALALKSLDELSDAAAHSLFYLSNTSDTIRPEGKVIAKKIPLPYRGNFPQR